MNTEKFSEAMGKLDSKYVEEAVHYRAKKPNRWARWGALAACLCIMAAGGAVLAQNGKPAAPSPSLVEVTSPIITVQSAAEMEEYLDFPVPVLDKEAASYSVFVTDGYPTMGQVDYADGSAFRVQYGSGDISGIYGGSLVETRELEGVSVHFYAYADTSYAIWEQDGFSFSYEYTGDGAAEVQTLIQRFR